MKRWRGPIVLVGLALWAVPARAHEPNEPYGAPGQIFFAPTQIAPPAATPPTQTGPAAYTPPQYPHLEREPGNPKPIRNTLQRFGVGCWAHVSSVTCGSLRSNLTFVFGSCRAYFGESCAHGPPAVPMPEEPRPPSTAPFGVLPPLPVPYAPPPVLHP